MTFTRDCSLGYIMYFKVLKVLAIVPMHKETPYIHIIVPFVVLGCCLVGCLATLEEATIVTMFRIYGSVLTIDDVILK